MTTADAVLRAGRHEPPCAPRAIRAGERLDPAYRRPRARLSPGLAVGVVVEAGLIATLLAIAAPSSGPPPVPVAITIVTQPPLPAPAAAPPAAPALAPPPAAPGQPLPLEAPLAPVPPLPDHAAAEDVLTLPPEAGVVAPQALLADLAAGPGLPVVPRPPPPTVHLPPRPAARPAGSIRRLPRVAPDAAPAVPGPPAAAAAPAVAAAAASPEAAAAAAPSRAGIDSYEGRLRAAIQAALRYPPAASMMGSNGRARVSFTIRDARPADIRLVRGTGSPQLDDAALSAVRQAAYPRPPTAISGREMPMLIWVEFDHADTDG